MLPSLMECVELRVGVCGGPHDGGFNDLLTMHSALSLDMHKQPHSSPTASSCPAVGMEVLARGVCNVTPKNFTNYV
jgi:hypothetical protein